MSNIEFSVGAEGVGQLTFNRPEVRNALTWEDMDLFASTIERIEQWIQLEEQPRLRALILFGTGGSFCAGGDLNDVHLHRTKSDAEWMATKMGEALDLLERLPIPTIAAIEGAAFGGGAEIAVACDLRVMSETSRIGWVQTSLGITTGWGGSHRLLRILGYSGALDCLMGARIIDAAEALRLGLTNRRALEGNALQHANELALEIIQYDPVVIKTIKEILLAGVHDPPAGSAQKEREVFSTLWTSTTHLDAIQSFSEKRTGTS